MVLYKNTKCAGDYSIGKCNGLQKYAKATGEDKTGQDAGKKGLHKRLCNPGFKTQLKKIPTNI